MPRSGQRCACKLLLYRGALFFFSDGRKEWREREKPSSAKKSKKEEEKGVENNCAWWRQDEKGEEEGGPKPPPPPTTFPGSKFPKISFERVCSRLGDVKAGKINRILFWTVTVFKPAKKSAKSCVKTVL